MLFNSLDKLKRTMVMMIICLLFAGLTMFVIPVSYIPILGKVLGFGFLVLAILKILDFISSKKGDDQLYRVVAWSYCRLLRDSAFFV